MCIIYFIKSWIRCFRLHNVFVDLDLYLALLKAFFPFIFQYNNEGNRFKLIILLKVQRVVARGGNFGNNTVKRHQTKLNWHKINTRICFGFRVMFVHAYNFYKNLFRVCVIFFTRYWHETRTIYTVLVVAACRVGRVFLHLHVRRIDVFT